MSEILDFKAIQLGDAKAAPYPHFIAERVILASAQKALIEDFPDIPRPGFFPLTEMKVVGAFQSLIRDFSSDAFADIMSEKLGLPLREHPRLITVRKWSALKDGPIHNDGAAKIATILIYLNDGWADSGAGCFRFLNGPNDMNDFVSEVPPSFGAMAGFRRTENSWHGHPPFKGERRVVQMAYLRSQEDLDRKARRGRWSLFLKRLNPFARPGEM
jgi:SM-20-related protein